jgi:hypothetical protein
MRLSLLDMSAAFEAIYHNVLFTKLEKMVIKDDALDWLRMYLSLYLHLHPPQLESCIMGKENIKHTRIQTRST